MAEEIKPLTSARGIAATLVMIYHFHQLDAIPSEALLNIVKRGYLWVDLFFILSGFVMAMTYRNMFAETFTWANYKNFLIKRIARVYPMYLFVTLGISLYTLIIYGGYVGVKRPAVNLEDPITAHITNILMIQAWGFGNSIGGPTWSISTEWAAYLLFPILIYLAYFSRSVVAVMCALLSAGLLFYAATTPEAGQVVRNGQLDIYHGTDALVLIRCLTGFYFGLAAFRVVQNWKNIEFLYRDSVSALVIFTLLTLIALGVADLWIYPFLILMVPALYGNRGKVAAFFSNRLFYILGLLSYSIYLIHYHFHVVLQQLQKRLPAYMPEDIGNMLAAVIVYSAIFTTSYLCYNYIEKPSRNWFKKFSR